MSLRAYELKSYMNVLFLTNHLNIGGITSYVSSLAAGLKKRGHDIYVATSGGECLTGFRQAGITCLAVPLNTKKELSPRILFSSFRLRRWLKEVNIDIIHANSRTTSVLACLLKRYTGISFITTCHGFFKVRPLRKIFPCWGDRVIAISDPVKVHLITDFGLAASKISVVHNGIDTDRFKVVPENGQESAKRGLGLTAGPVVGIIARLADIKGHAYLIRAMKSVLERIPDAQLLIVGDGKEQKNLVSLVSRLNMQKNVSMIASCVDTDAVFSAMDIFVLPSLEEGLGLSLMEAGAKGLAVIGTDIGGIRSVVKDGFNGFLVRPKDAVDLANSILKLLESADLRKQMGRNGADFIRKNFSLEGMAAETEKVYLKCLEEKSI